MSDKKPKPTRPVSTGFLETLQETAHDVLQRWLEENKTPESAIVLFRALNSMPNYVLELERGRDVSGWGMEEVVIETINAIDDLGGRSAAARLKKRGF